MRVSKLRCIVISVRFARITVIALTLCSSPMLAQEAAGWGAGIDPDRNGDGEVVVACLGDSNTQVGWQEKKPNGFAPEFGWCEQLGDLLGDRARTVNLGMGGATLLDHPVVVPSENGPVIPADAGRQMEIALERHSPDIVILAFGTNDLFTAYGFDAQAVARAYRERWGQARARDLIFLVATAPQFLSRETIMISPRFKRGGGARQTDEIDMLNRKLRMQFPERLLVDFGTGFGTDQFMDRVHLNADGQRLRALLAYDGIRRALHQLPPVGAARQLGWSRGRWTTFSPRSAVVVPLAEPILAD